MQSGISFICLIIIQQYGLLKAKETKDVFKIGTAERKILISFSYYVLFTVVALTAFTIATRNSESLAEQLSHYFACEGKGNDPNNPCDRNTFLQLTIPLLSVIGFILVFLLPAVNLVYVLNIKELKEKFTVMKKFQFSSTAQTNYSSN